MEVTIMRKLLVLIVAATLIPMAAFAGERAGKHGRMDFFKNLGLNKEQITEVKKLHLQNRRERVKLRSETELKQIDFQEELQKPQWDKKVLDQLIEEIGELAAKKKKMKLGNHVKIMTILTPEQKEKMVEQMGVRMFGGGGGGRKAEDRGRKAENSRQ